jgi:hypothetical protein
MSSIQSVLRDVDKCIKYDGFRRKGFTWNRERADFVDVIDVQKHSAVAEIVVNYGVFSRTVRGIVWPDAVERHVQQPSCVVRRRVRTDDGSRERWFDSTSNLLAELICQSLQSQVMPCLARVVDPGTMLFELGDNKPRLTQDEIYRAVLLSMIGHQEEACIVLRESIFAAGESKWGTRLQGVAIRLRCQP